MANPLYSPPIQQPPFGAESPLPVERVVYIEEQGQPQTTVNPKTGVVKVEHEDGSVVIYPNGLPSEPKANGKWDDNLVDEIDSFELSRHIEELIEGIEADHNSRREHLQDIADGIKMLGFKLETITADAAVGGAPTEGLSRVYHPLLAEAVLRFQANARGELLPASGPVKVDDAGQDQGGIGDDLAQELEDGFNYYLTVTASEYYPDTNRMLFNVGFGGSGFKKIYHCPIRERPVSESVMAEHLVVSNAATDLRNCERITHIIEMPPATLKRLQIIGTYKDVELGEAWGNTDNPVDLTKREVTGLDPNAATPRDKPHTLYEVRCKIDLKGFEDKDSRGPTGLPLPWKVTIHKESRQCLEWRRDWREDDPRKLAKRTYVKYPYVDALGFYGIGLFHILCNPTRALTAAWRMMLDSGMYSNVPAFLVDKAVARQLTNDFRAAPGQGIPLDLGQKTMAQVAMPIPYKDVSPPFLALSQEIAQTGQRVGGTAELPVGEGRQDAPVGTTIALIEQSTKVEAAVHKGLHSAQAEEFQILKELFEEDPEAFWRHRPDETSTWNEEKLLAALKRCDIVPVADPNTPGQIQRIMKAQALVQLAMGPAGQFMRVDNVLEDSIRALGYGNPDRYINTAALQAMASGQQPPDPKGQASLLSAQADLQDSQTKAAELQYKMKTAAVEDQNRDKDRQSKEFIARTELARDAIIHNQSMQAQQMMQSRELQADYAKHMGGLQNQQHMHAGGLVSDHEQQLREHRHQLLMKALELANQPVEQPKTKSEGK